MYKGDSMQDVVNTKIPFDYEDMCYTITKLADTYDEASLFSIGKSSLKRELYCLKIGNGEPAVFYCGIHHSLEWITGLILMKFAEDLLQSARDGKEISGVNAKYLINNRSIYIVPMVNPDGTELVINGSKNTKLSAKLKKMKEELGLLLRPILKYSRLQNSNLIQ